MLIKKSNSRGPLWRPTIVIALAMTLFLAGFALSHRLYHTVESAQNKLSQLIAVADVERVQQVLSANPDTITLDIKHTDYMKLEHQRVRGLEVGRLVGGDDDWVSATIRHNDQALKAKIRLKGDQTDHLVDKQWSFRVKLKGGKTLFGMNSFSLSHPARRNYIGEWLWHKVLRAEEIIALRYDFLDLTVNGEKWGPYAIEEHFEKRLIENNDRREGPIVRFKDDRFWAMKERRGSEGFSNNDRDWDRALFTNSEAAAYGSGKMLGSPLAREQMLTALALLEEYRAERMTPDEVFDLDKLATFIAITDLFSAHHGLVWFNIRFYLNPVVGRLEPVAYDGIAFGKPLVSLAFEDLRSDDAENYLYPLLSNQRFMAKYVSELTRISSKQYIDQLLAEHSEEMNEKLAIIYSGSPLYDFDPKVLHHNASVIRASLEPESPIYANSQDPSTLAIANTQRLPIEIIGFEGKRTGRHFLHTPILIPGKFLDQPLDYLNIDLPLIPEEKIKVVYRLLGSETAHTRNVAEAPVPDEQAFFGIAWKRPNHEKFDFLVTDETRKEIGIKPGNWTLSEALILPRGYTIVATSGTTLDLTNRAMILSRSPVHFVGSEESPILITSSDATGEGLTVLQAASSSLMEHVAFDRLRAPKTKGWVLPGAVTFYESQVTIRHCLFTRNESEDGLNLFRSPYTIYASTFSQNASDAFDADFSDGIVSDSYFLDCANDAIDISGSFAKVHNVRFDRIGDKALSAGERSRMEVSDITVDQAEIAVASKDHSYVKLENATLENCRVGFTVFQKKPEFGPAIVESEGLRQIAVEVPHLVERESKLTLDGSPVAVIDRKVEEILYGNEYGTNSADTNPLKKAAN